MLGVDQQLLRGLVYGGFALLKHLAVAHQERHGHKHSIEPELVLPAERMPEAAVFCARICIKGVPNRLRRRAVLLLAGLFVEHQQQIAGQYVVQRRDGSIDLSTVVDVMVDPALYVIEIPAIAVTLVEEILSVEVERDGITPSSERRRCGLAR